MSVIREVFNKDTALAEAGSYPYAIIYTNSGIKFGKTSDIWMNDKLSFNEARFFGTDEELHFFSYDSEMRVVRTQKNDSEYIEKKDPLQNQFGFCTITVREYLEVDEDGQTFVSATVLSGVEMPDSKRIL